MGFKYVLIPCSASDDMQELEYYEDVDDLTKDSFRSFVEKYFSNLGQAADRGVLLEQLKERTGVNLQEEAASGGMSGEALNQLLSATSVEIFCVMLPTKDTGFSGVSVYCDDKGVAKGLEENPRAGGLVQACGYPGQTFRGDIFIGKIFDDNEDEWRRCDLTLKECNSDSDIARMTRKQRENRCSGDLSSLAGKMGVKNPAKITPDTMQGEAPKGETEQYRWHQTDDEVEVTFKQDGLQKGDKKVVKVVFARQRLKVEVKGEVLIDSALCGQTQTDECTWTLSEGVLQVTLSKANAENWSTLTKS